MNLLHSGVDTLSFCIKRQLFLSENTLLYPFTLEKFARLKFELILKTFIRLVLIFGIGYPLIILFKLIIAIVSLFKINLLLSIWPLTLVINFTKKYSKNSPHFTLCILHNPLFPLSYSLSHSLYSRNFIDE